MFEALMTHLRPVELEKVRAILVDAFNERGEEFKAEMDGELCTPLHFINKAIDIIDQSM